MKNRIKPVANVATQTVVVGVAALLPVGHAAAAEETLECTLYIATSMDPVSSHEIALENAGATLDSGRRSGFCVFADGSVADKQWVSISHSTEGGASGIGRGYSVYTLQSGDSVSAEFQVGWGQDGLQGTYNILGGTGKFQDASGDGTITGMQSPWKTSAVVGIVLNVKTP